MIQPKPMWSPPKPTAMRALPHAADPSSATAPRTMKQSPMSGTTRTEKAPPVTTPVP